MDIPLGDELPAQPPITAGEILLDEFLEPVGLTQKAAAEKMGMPLNRLNELIHGKRGVTADTALRLSELFGTTPQYWMNLQATTDLYEARLRRQKRRERELAGAR